MDVENELRTALRELASRVDEIYFEEVWISALYGTMDDVIAELVEIDYIDFSDWIQIYHDSKKLNT